VRGLGVAALASAFYSDETNGTEEKHDYEDYDAEQHYVHFVLEF
jgi:hypothetical protein